MRPRSVKRYRRRQCPNLSLVWFPAGSFYILWRISLLLSVFILLNHWNYYSLKTLVCIRVLTWETVHILLCRFRLSMSVVQSRDRYRIFPRFVIVLLSWAVVLFFLLVALKFSYEFLDFFQLLFFWVWCVRFDWFVFVVVAPNRIVHLLSTTKSHHLHPNPHLTSPSLRQSRKITGRQPTARRMHPINSRWRQTATTGIIVHPVLWIIRTEPITTPDNSRSSSSSTVDTTRMDLLRRPPPPTRRQLFTTATILTVTKTTSTADLIPVRNFIVLLNDLIFTIDLN